MTEQAEINRIAAEAFEALKDVPPERLLLAMIAHARKFGFKEQERAFRRALWRHRLQKWSFGILG